MSTMDINIEDTVSVVEATPEAVVEATPEAVVEATPEVVVEATPEVVVEATPEAVLETVQEENIKLDVVETHSNPQVLPLPFYVPNPYTQTVAPPQKAVPPPTPSLRHRFSMPGFSFMRS